MLGTRRPALVPAVKPPIGDKGLGGERSKIQHSMLQAETLPHDRPEPGKGTVGNGTLDDRRDAIA